MNEPAARIPLDRALPLAEKIVLELTPFCEKIQIAGSIRRQRPDVGDIDIVAIPSHRGLMRDRMLRTHPRILKDGNSCLIVELAGRYGPIQVDLWLASAGHGDLFTPTPTNFGSLLICRTGSVSHNIFLVEHAKRMNLRWNPYWGVFDQFGKCIASETEESIFQALKLDFVPPELREK